MTSMAEPHDEAPNPGGEELHRFSEYALPEPLVQAINDLGYERCTPIQGQVLPLSLADYDITGQAQTGTGKTAAFLITILTHLWEQPRKHAPKSQLPAPRSLVLAPTRELAMQIEADGTELARHMDQDALCVVGGMDIQKQVNRLNAERPNILIATPGRLIDLLQRGWVDIGSVEILVIDEADRMLDMGFIPDVRRIVYRTPHKHRRQTLFFSATFNDDVMRLAQSWTLEPEHIAIAPEQVAVDTVEQLFWLTSREGKRQLLRDFLQDRAAGARPDIRQSARPDPSLEPVAEQQGHRQRSLGRRRAPKQAHPNPKPVQGGEDSLRGGHRRGRARHSRRWHQPRHQLRPAGRRRGLRPSHRAHRPGWRLRSEHQLRLRRRCVQLTRH